MVFVFFFKTKKYFEKVFNNDPDPLTGENGVIYTVTQRYLWLLIPIYAIGRKTVNAYSLNNRQAIPASMWTQSMQQKAALLKKEAKGSWKLYSLLIIISIVLAIAIPTVLLNTHSEKDDIQMQAQLKAEPNVGDLVLVNVVPSLQTSTDNWYGTVFKIERINGDSLFVRRSKQKESLKKAYSISNLTEIMNKFPTSDDTFYPDVEIYKLKDFKLAGEPILNPISKEYDKEHLLQIKFIRRPI